MPRKEQACQNAYQREWYRKNKKKVIASVQKQKAKRIKWLQEFKSKTPCADCSIHFPHYVMDFDHRDPSMKSGILSQMVRTKGMKAIKDEIAKCDLVCSNCHRERTFGSSANTT